MKKFIWFLIAGVFLLLTGCQKDLDFVPDLPALGDEEITLRDNGYPAEVIESIDKGIEWMLTLQHPDGYFYSTSEGVARTGLVITKLCDRSVELGFFPPSDGPYGDEITAGLNYIFRNAQENTDGGIYLSNNDGHSVYNTGIAMMALAAARCPDCVIAVGNPVVDGKTYEQLLQSTVDFFAVAQNDDGGWRYFDHSQPSDNSNTGFAVLGLLAAQGAGIDMPPGMKDKLSLFIDFIQNDATGGSGYTDPNGWVNIMKTGNLLFEMAFVGDEVDDARVQHALQYIGNHWEDNNTDPGWRPNNYLAMYCLMKGFVTMEIDKILVGATEVDWYADLIAKIIPQQNANGSWNADGYWLGDPQLSTAFNLLTLEKITPTPFVRVFVDIKPTSCPNPLNRGSNGVIPVAILGTEGFDVTKIDPETVNIDGVYAAKWNHEDVATPYTGGTSFPPSEMDCTTDGPDGFMDLVLHFPALAVGELFSANEKGDLIFVELDGKLKDSEVKIKGGDIMIIKK